MEEVVQWAANVMDHKTGIEKKDQVGKRNTNVYKVAFVKILHYYHSILHYVWLLE